MKKAVAALLAAWFVLMAAAAVAGESAPPAFDAESFIREFDARWPHAEKFVWEVVPEAERVNRGGSLLCLTGSLDIPFGVGISSLVTPEPGLAVMISFLVDDPDFRGIESDRYVTRDALIVSLPLLFPGGLRLDPEKFKEIQQTASSTAIEAFHKLDNAYYASAIVDPFCYVSQYIPEIDVMIISVSTLTGK